MIRGQHKTYTTQREVFVTYSGNGHDDFLQVLVEKVRKRIADGVTDSTIWNENFKAVITSSVPTIIKETP